VRDRKRDPKKTEIIMKALIGAAALLAALTIGSPTLVQAAQNMQSQQNLNAQNLNANESGTGVKGLPGGKSGPTVTPTGKVARETRGRPAGFDEAGIRGLPGDKSGITARPRG
jgi:hypothetical protein